MSDWLEDGGEETPETVRDHANAGHGMENHSGDTAPAEPDPDMVALVAALRRELYDGPRPRALSELGLTERARFVLYGLSLWPVIRQGVRPRFHRSRAASIPHTAMRVSTCTRIAGLSPRAAIATP